MKINFSGSDTNGSFCWEVFEGVWGLLKAMVINDDEGGVDSPRWCGWNQNILRSPTGRVLNLSYPKGKILQYVPWQCCQKMLSLPKTTLDFLQDQCPCTCKSVCLKWFSRRRRHHQFSIHIHKRHELVLSSNDTCKVFQYFYTYIVPKNITKNNRGRALQMLEFKNIYGINERIKREGITQNVELKAPIILY